MKRLFAALVMASMTGQAWGAGFYVRPYMAGGYGPSNGTSFTAAFNGFDRIRWGAGDVQAGDTLYVCGEHLNEYFNVGASGTSDEARKPMRCTHVPNRTREMWRLRCGE